MAELSRYQQLVQGATGGNTSQVVPPANTLTASVTSPTVSTSPTNTFNPVNNLTSLGMTSANTVSPTVSAPASAMPSRYQQLVSGQTNPSAISNTAPRVTTTPQSVTTQPNVLSSNVITDPTQLQALARNNLITYSTQLPTGVTAPTDAPIAGGSNIRYVSDGRVLSPEDLTAMQSSYFSGVNPSSGDQIGDYYLPVQGVFQWNGTQWQYTPNMNNMGYNAGGSGITINSSSITNELDPGKWITGANEQGDPTQSLVRNNLNVNYTPPDMTGGQNVNNVLSNNAYSAPVSTVPVPTSVREVTNPDGTTSYEYEYSSTDDQQVKTEDGTLIGTYHYNDGTGQWEYQQNYRKPEASNFHNIASWALGAPVNMQIAKGIDRLVGNDDFSTIAPQVMTYGSAIVGGAISPWIGALAPTAQYAVENENSQLGTAATIYGTGVLGGYLGGLAGSYASPATNALGTATANTTGSTIAGGVVGGAAQGLVSGAVSGGVTAGLQGNNIGEGIVKGGAMGALSGGISGGVNAARPTSVEANAPAYTNSLIDPYNVASNVLTAGAKTAMGTPWENAMLEAGMNSLVNPVANRTVNNTLQGAGMPNNVNLNIGNTLTNLAANELGISPQQRQQQAIADRIQSNQQRAQEYRDWIMQSAPQGMTQQQMQQFIAANPIDNMGKDVVNPFADITQDGRIVQPQMPTQEQYGQWLRNNAPPGLTQEEFIDWAKAHPPTADMIPADNTTPDTPINPANPAGTFVGTQNGRIGLLNPLYHLNSDGKMQYIPELQSWLPYNVSSADMQLYIRDKFIPQFQNYMPPGMTMNDVIGYLVNSGLVS